MEDHSHRASEHSENLDFVTEDEDESPKSRNHKDSPKPKFSLRPEKSPSLIKKRDSGKCLSCWVWSDQIHPVTQKYSSIPKDIDDIEKEAANLGIHSQKTNELM